jgi:hypothetical protein
MSHVRTSWRNPLIEQLIVTQLFNNILTLKLCDPEDSLPFSQKSISEPAQSTPDPHLLYPQNKFYIYACLSEIVSSLQILQQTFCVHFSFLPLTSRRVIIDLITVISIYEAYLRVILSVPLLVFREYKHLYCEGESVNKANLHFFTDIYPLCTLELSTAFLHVWTCNIRNFLINLAILSLTVCFKNDCVDAILKFTLFIDSPS